LQYLAVPRTIGDELLLDGVKGIDERVPVGEDRSWGPDECGFGAKRLYRKLRKLVDVE
jgi:hypothetical protein